MIQMPSLSVRLIFALLLAVLGAASVFFAGMSLGAYIFGAEPSQFLGIVTDTKAFGGNATRYFLAVQGISLFGIPALSIAFACKHDFEALRFSSIGSAGAAAASAMAIVAASPFIGLLGELNRVAADIVFGPASWFAQSEYSAMQITKGVLHTSSYAKLAANMLCMALVPAVFEEMFFRGALQGLIAKRLRNHHLAIWAAAFIFSAMHFQFYGFVPRLIMGAFMGYLYVWYGNLWMPIIAHFANNAAAILVYFLVYNGHLPAWAEPSGVSLPLAAAGAASLILFIPMLRYLRSRKIYGLGYEQTSRDSYLL
jgi:uncharacterized protein